MYYIFLEPLSLSLLCQGFLKLSVWLYLDPSTCSAGLHHTDNGHAKDQMLEVVTAGESDSRLPSVRVGHAAVKSIGQVEITDEASLEDLKAQVKILKSQVEGRSSSLSVWSPFHT